MDKTYNKRCGKITIPNSTEYSFQYIETENDSDYRPTDKVLSNCSEWEDILLQGKIVHINRVQLVGKNKLKLAKATLADESGTIQLDIWEEHIEQINVGKIYKFTPVQVRIWNNIKRVTTLKKLLLGKSLQEGNLAQLKVEEDKIKSNSGEVAMSVQNLEMIEKVDKFICCSNPKYLRKSLQATSASIVHCDKCGNSMKTIKCKLHICVKFVLKIEEQNIHLTAFEEELKNARKCN